MENTSVYDIPTEFNSVWIIHYDPQQDSGFTIYNEKNDCFLLSTFKSFPDYYYKFRTDSDGGIFSDLNDTFSHFLHLETEVACYESPTPESATFFVVDGAIAAAPKEPSMNLGERFTDNIVSKLHWTYELISSQVLMQRFRHHHHELQDTPLHVVQSHSSCLLFRISWLYLLVLFLARAIKKRKRGSPAILETRFIHRTAALVVIYLMMNGIGFTKAWRVNSALVAAELTGFICLVRETITMLAAS